MLLILGLTPTFSATVNNFALTFGYFFNKLSTIGTAGSTSSATHKSNSYCLKKKRRYCQTKKDTLYCIVRYL